MSKDVAIEDRSISAKIMLWSTAGVFVVSLLAMIGGFFSYTEGKFATKESVTDIKDDIKEMKEDIKTILRSHR